MKTYFMAWESDNKRGHAICDFEDGTAPQEAFREMINTVIKGFSESGIPLQGVVSATQFNLVT